MPSFAAAKNPYFQALGDIALNTNMRCPPVTAGSGLANRACLPRKERVGLQSWAVIGRHGILTITLRLAEWIDFRNAGCELRVSLCYILTSIEMLDLDAGEYRRNSSPSAQ